MSDYKPIEKLDYSFYKWIHISKDLTDLCYVGSTANITNRKRKHKNTYNNPNCKAYNNLLYSTMREYGFENFKMVILGTAEQLTKREAEAIEEEYRVAEKANLNGRRCYITDEQNKQEKTEHNKQYRQDHKQEIAEYKKQHYHDHKQEIAEYKKQYYQDNIEIRKIQQRINYLKHKINNKKN